MSLRKPQVSIKSQSWEIWKVKKFWTDRQTDRQRDRQTDIVTYTIRWSRIKTYKNTKTQKNAKNVKKVTIGGTYTIRRSQIRSGFFQMTGHFMLKVKKSLDEWVPEYRNGFNPNWKCQTSSYAANTQFNARSQWCRAHYCLFLQSVVTSSSWFSFH